MHFFSVLDFSMLLVFIRYRIFSLDYKLRGVNIYAHKSEQVDFCQGKHPLCTILIPILEL